MEQLIQNLLVCDNEVHKQAAAQLEEAFKRPETIGELCGLVVTAGQPHIRQYAAFLLRRRLGKLSNWQLVSPEQQILIKQGMLNALLQEQEKSVRNSIAQFIGVLVKHEFDKKDSWMNDILKFIFQYCSSANPAESELGASVFSVLMDFAPDQFVPHLEAICDMFSAAMVATEASGNMATPVVYHIMLGMTHLVPFILGNNTAEHTYQKAMPYIIRALQAFAVQDPDRFVKAFDLLENLADYAPKLLTPSVKPIVDFCLEASSNIQLDSAVRIKSFAYIGWLVRLKKKAIIKQKLIEPIIRVVFSLMSTQSEEDDEEEEYYVGSSNATPMTTATQTLDLVALHVPPEKVIPPLLELLEPALKGTDPLAKKAAFLSMAVIAEGCSEAICSKYLSGLLDVVKIGITDSNTYVRNAAFFALGQFSEHLQPDISKYAPDILPILFEFLQNLCVELRNGGKEPKHIERMFYALETYCENLEDALIPHLPHLMERLFESLNTNNSVRLRELALSAVSATANAAKENILPYFPQLIEYLKTYLVKSTDDDICALQPQAIDTLASMARTVGADNFMPLVADTMAFSLAFLEDNDDSEVKRAIYNLIASMAGIMKTEMAPVLPKVVEKLIEPINKAEDKSNEIKEEAEEDLNREIDIEQSDGEDDDDINLLDFEDNIQLSEKEESILALKEIAENTGVAFIPYIQPCFEAIFKLINHPYEDIRKVAMDALATFIITLHKQNDHQGVLNAVIILMPKLTEAVRTDDECTVAISALETIGQLLKELKNNSLPNEEMKDLIFSAIFEVMNGKVACQFDEPLDGEDDQQESENDEALIETAGNALPLFGHALQPEQFALYFGRICPTILQKIEKTRNREESEAQRCFAYGALSECFSPLQNYTSTYFETLLPVFLIGVADKYELVRQNSVFGLGELVLFSEQTSYEHYPKILAALSNAVSKEKHVGTLDNICGAIARLIMTNYKLVPLEQVLPVFLKHLPLKEDFDENASVFKCFQILYVQGVEILLQFIEEILAICLHILYKKEYKDEATYENILAFLKEFQQKFPDKFTNVINQSYEIATFVQSL